MDTVLLSVDSEGAVLDIDEALALLLGVGGLYAVAAGGDLHRAAGCCEVIFSLYAVVYGSYSQLAAGQDHII